MLHGLGEARLLSIGTSTGSTALTCVACRQGIRDDDMVHQVLEQVFHQRCFNCSICSLPLQTGQKFYGGLNGKVVCARHDKLMEATSAKARKDSVTAAAAEVSPMTTATPASSSCSTTTSSAVSPTSPSPATSTKTDSSTSATTPTSTDASNSAPSPQGSDEEGQKKDQKASPGKKQPGKRAARAVIKGPILEVLKNTFAVNPKPSRQVRERLCQETGLSMRTVLVWFQHRRSKERWMQSCMAKTDAPNQFPVTADYNQQWLNPQYQQALYSGNTFTDMSAMMSASHGMGFPPLHPQQQQQQRPQHISPHSQQAPNNCYLYGDFNSMQQQSAYPVPSGFHSQASGAQNNNWNTTSLSSTSPNPLDSCLPVTSSLMSSSLMSSSSLPSLRNGQASTQLNQSVPSIMSTAAAAAAAVAGLPTTSSLCSSTPNLTSVSPPVCSRPPPPRYPSSSDSGLPEDLLSVAEDLASLQGSQHSLFSGSPHPLSTALDFPSSASLSPSRQTNKLAHTPSGRTGSRSDLLNSHLSQVNLLQASLGAGSSSNLSHLLDGLGPLDNCFENFQASVAI